MPLELQIIELAKNVGEVYGFQIAKELQRTSKSKSLVGYGTLYRALGRLVKMGYLTARWEDYLANLSESRPRRRYYKLTNKIVEGMK